MLFGDGGPAPADEAIAEKKPEKQNNEVADVNSANDLMQMLGSGADDHPVAPEDDGGTGLGDAAIVIEGGSDATKKNQPNQTNQDRK